MYKQLSILIVFILFSVAIVNAANYKTLDVKRGWNDEIEWYSHEEGLKAAKELNKPMLYLFHSTSCGACKRLKPDFASNKQIEELSKNFVMVNIENKETPSSDPKFTKDGGYIPRVYFADSTGKPDYSYNSGNAKYHYFYGGAAQIAQQMSTYVKDHQ
mmetsp:Transcript_4498/g.9842  ORF Transcript_4498/g.9842 Transcript_4498/m.9842 type:complete len:158 (-) Transcript_4498:28-501(-)